MTTRKWGSKSKAVFATLDPRLQAVMDLVLTDVADIILLEGFRDEAAQNAAFAAGKSKLQWPNGNHNKNPSLAVDFTTFPVNLDSKKLKEELAYVAGAAKALAGTLGFKLRWGGDWDQDGDLEDQKFDDLFHLEIVE